MKGVASILASVDNTVGRSAEKAVQQPLKVVAAPNDVWVYYERYVRVFHADGEGNTRYNITEAVYNIPTSVSGDMTGEPPFAEPETVSETILRPLEDPYYKITGGT